MGAVYLQKGAGELPAPVAEVFRRKGFGNPRIVQAGDTSVFYYPKQLTGSGGIYSSDGLTVITTGTCIYRGVPTPVNLEFIHRHKLNGEFDPSMLMGNFLILFIAQGKITLCSDRIGQYSFYCHKESGVLSSSFLAAIRGASQRSKLRLSRSNTTEVLLTGNAFGSETMVEGITRYLPYDSHSESLFETVPYGRAVEFSEEASLEGQLRLLDRHFERYASLLDSKAVVSGLTGGLDSRLLYLLLRRHFQQVQTFTNTYDTASRECSCAAEFARMAAAPFKCFTPERPEEMETPVFREMLRDGFHFWDGVCRIHHLWLEKRKSRGFLREVYGGTTAGVSGVGGERFRIHDGLLSPSYAIDPWIDNEILFNVCGNALLKKDEAREFHRSFKDRVKRLSGASDGERRIDLKSIRSFYDIVYNTANRTLRSSIENQLVYFVSPFVEPGISAVDTDFLTSHRFFELELIRALGPDLADVMTSYGYSPGSPKPLRDRVLFMAKRRYLFSTFHSVRRFLRRNEGTLAERLLSKHPFLKEYLDRVEELELPLDLGRILSCDSLSPLVLQTGMFLAEMEDCLDLS